MTQTASLQSCKMATKPNNEGGYDCDFVSEPDESFQCGICLSVAKNPRQHSKCGRLFCMECLRKYKKRKGNCPYCRQERAVFFEDNRSNLQIKSLSVRCSRKHHGCTWEGELRELQEHSAGKCHYRKVDCPLGCDKDILWINVDQHTKEECVNRDYECSDCKVKGKYHQIAGEHAQNCLMALEKCPSEGCDIEISSILINFHLQTECQFAEFECKYKNAGCEVTAGRSDIAKHEQDDSAHLELAMSMISTQMKYIEKISYNLEAVKGAMYPNVFKIDNFRFSKTETQIEYFLNYPAPYRLVVQFLFKKRDIAMYFYIVEGPFDDVLEWPFSGKITVELLNQQEDRVHFENDFDFPKECGAKPKPQEVNDQGYGFPSFITYKKLRDKSAQYVQNDTLYFRVKVAAKEFKSWLFRPTST